MRGEGESREGREQICPCTTCSLHACSFTLRLSFSYIHSAVEASFDIKKACGKPYSADLDDHTVILGDKIGS